MGFVLIYGLPTEFIVLLLADQKKETKTEDLQRQEQVSIARGAEKVRSSRKSFAFPYDSDDEDEDEETMQKNVSIIYNLYKGRNCLE